MYFQWEGKHHIVLNYEILPLYLVCGGHSNSILFVFPVALVLRMVKAKVATCKRIVVTEYPPFVHASPW